MLGYDRATKNHSLEGCLRISATAAGTLPSLKVGHKTVWNKWSHVSKIFIIIFIITKMPKNDRRADYLGGYFNYRAMGNCNFLLCFPPF